MGKKSEFSLTEFLLDKGLSEGGGEDHLKKWLEYKAGRGPADPDNTPEAYSFYSYLWGEEIEQQQLVNTHPFPVYVQGDWMCSVWTTLRRGLKLVDSEALEESGITLGRDGYPTLRGCINNGKLLENFDRFTILKDEHVHRFIYNSYTRANLIIVPRGLNQKRGRAPTHDYWDEALERLLQQVCIATRYRTLREYAEFFQRLLGHLGIGINGEAFKAEPYKAPLFLQDWVTADWQPEMLPTKEPVAYEEWLNLVREMTCRIIRRRTAMQDYLDYLKHE